MTYSQSALLFVCVCELLYYLSVPKVRESASVKCCIDCLRLWGFVSHMEAVAEAQHVGRMPYICCDMSQLTISAEVL